MGRIEWHKRRHEKELDDARDLKLTLEQRGALVTITDLIYKHVGDLRDDGRYIAGQMGVDPRVWKRVREQLITLGKIHIEEGRLCNGDAGAGVLAALDAIASSAHAGRSKGSKYRSQSGQFNQLALSLDANPIERIRIREESTTTESVAARGRSAVVATQPRAQIGRRARSETEIALLKASGLTVKGA